MIHLFQCLSCGGVYQDQDAAGTAYNHVCPPLPPDKHGIAQLRPDARDETVIAGEELGAYTIRSEGQGVKCLTSDKITEPRWISHMKLQATQVDATGMLRR